MEAIVTRAWIALLAALLLARPAAATTETVNYTDIWWNPAESGWGVTVTQASTTMFLTFFVYANDGKPTWVTATLRQSGQSSAGQPVFTGALNATTGTYYGSPWNASQLTLRVAGTATFTATGSTTATLAYAIDGVQVTKTIQRQLLVNENLSGSYVAVASLTITCGTSPPRTTIVTAPVTITQSGNTFQWREFDPNSPADYCLTNGTSVQEGQLARASGSTTCTSGGRTGTLTLTDIASTPNGLTGRYSFAEQVAGVSCVSAGPFSALRP
jgi:hypothetical protein